MQCGRVQAQYNTRGPHRKHKLQIMQPQITNKTNHSQSVVTTCLWPCKSIKTNCRANRKLIDQELKKTNGMWADCVNTYKNKTKHTQHQGGSSLHLEHCTFPVDAPGCWCLNVTHPPILLEENRHHQLRMQRNSVQGVQYQRKGAGTRKLFYNNFTFIINKTFLYQFDLWFLVTLN